MTTIDGLDESAIAALLGVPRAALFDEVGSTMDEAHRLGAEGTPAGTVIVAEAQTAGRGRGGRRWESGAGQGAWLTLLERPANPGGLQALSLRLGLHLAPVLDSFAGGRVMIKWPNDLYVGARKLGGVLVEARWRDESLEWVAIGIGINLQQPVAVSHATAVRSGLKRSELLAALVPPAREAAAARGPLSATELAAFEGRDHARGRRVLEPGEGTACGIAADGALAIDSGSARAYYRAGSLVYAGDS